MRPQYTKCVHVRLLEPQIVNTKHSSPRFSSENRDSFTSTHTRYLCASCWTAHTGGVGSVRSFRAEQAQRRKRGGLKSHPFGDGWTEQVMRRRYIETTKELHNYLTLVKADTETLDEVKGEVTDNGDFLATVFPDFLSD